MPLVEGPITLGDRWKQNFEVEEGKGYLLLAGGKLKEARTAAGVRRSLQWPGKSRKLLKLNTAQINMPVTVPGVLLSDGFSITVAATAGARFKLPEDDETFEEKIRRLIGARSFEELARQADVAVLEAATSILSVGFRYRTHSEVDPPNLHELRKPLHPTTCLDGLVEVRIDALTRIDPDQRARTLRDARIDAQVEEGRIFIKQMEELAGHRLKIRVGLERAQAMGIPALHAMEPELAGKMMQMRTEMIRILATNGNNVSVLIDTMQQLGLQPEFVEMLMSAVSDPIGTNALPQSAARGSVGPADVWPQQAGALGQSGRSNTASGAAGDGAPLSGARPESPPAAATQHPGHTAEAQTPDQPLGIVGLSRVVAGSTLGVLVLANADLPPALIEILADDSSVPTARVVCAVTADADAVQDNCLLLANAILSTQLDDPGAAQLTFQAVRTPVLQVVLPASHALAEEELRPWFEALEAILRSHGVHVALECESQPARVRAVP